jgi:hypothetical protein
MECGFLKTTKAYNDKGCLFGQPFFMNQNRRANY